MSADPHQNDKNPALEVLTTVSGPSLTYERGEYVYLTTDRLETLFLVNQGALKVGSYSASGQEVTYDVLTRGELVGNLHYLPGNTFSEFAKALTKVSVMTHPVHAFKEQIRYDVQLADQFQRMIVRRWCRAETRLFHIASLNSTQRIVQLLNQYPSQVVGADGQSHSLRDLLTQQDVADLCGLTRQTTSRILKKLYS